MLKSQYTVTIVTKIGLSENVEQRITVTMVTAIGLSWNVEIAICCNHGNNDRTTWKCQTE